MMVGMSDEFAPPDPWSAGRLLLGFCNVLVLCIDGFIAAYLVIRAAQGAYLTSSDLVLGAILALLAVGAAVVLVNLVRGRPLGSLAGVVAAVGLGLPALALGPYLFGLPFVY